MSDPSAPLNGVWTPGGEPSGSSGPVAPAPGDGPPQLELEPDALGKEMGSYSVPVKNRIHFKEPNG